MGNVVTGGSVQIGSQYVNVDGQELRAALADFRMRLLSLDPDFLPDRESVLELAEEAEEELNRSKPRKLKVTTLLSGVAMAVQAIPAVKPAYKAIKAAALQLGIGLP